MEDLDRKTYRCLYIIVSRCPQALQHELSNGMLLISPYSHRRDKQSIDEFINSRNLWMNPNFYTTHNGGKFALGKPKYIPEYDHNFGIESIGTCRCVIAQTIKWANDLRIHLRTHFAYADKLVIVSFEIHANSSTKIIQESVFFSLLRYSHITSISERIKKIQKK